MPDTGLPWEIPYIEPSDLVRDYPAADEAQALAIAAGLTTLGNAGIGANVVSTTKTDVFTTSSTSFTAITGLAATITPTSNTAKVLVMATVSVNTAATDNQVIGLRLMREATPIAIGDAGGSRDRGFGAIVGGNSLGRHGTGTVCVTFLDSPGSDTATTYSVEIRTDASTAGVNRSFTDANAAANVRTVSDVTLIEVRP
jgi:hypothetical protein